MYLYMVTTLITPGPNNLNMMYLSARYGLRGARKFFIASSLSLLVKCLLCGLLNIALSEFIPAAVVYLKWIGAAYMVYIGVVMALSGWKEDAGEDSRERESTYRSGIILQLLNMKSWVSALSVFAVYVIPYDSSILTVVKISVIFVLIMVACTLLWGLLGESLRRLIARYKKPFGIVMGLSLLYCAVTALL